MTEKQDDKPDADMSTRPSDKDRGKRPIEKSGTSRQPRHEGSTSPDAASGDPSE